MVRILGLLQGEDQILRKLFSQGVHRRLEKMFSYVVNKRRIAEVSKIYWDPQISQQMRARDVRRASTPTTLQLTGIPSYMRDLFDPKSP